MQLSTSLFICMRSVCALATVLSALSASLLQAQSTVPSVSQSIPPQTLVVGSGAAAIDLKNHFSVPGLSGTLVQFTTVFGKFNVELFSAPGGAPRHAANFLAYVQSGAYVNSFFHRSASFDGGSISIVQGGGYRVPIPVSEIPERPPVDLEYNLPNARGTLAAARTSAINSATSEWFFNVRDNSTTLGPTNGGGYSVFGRVLGTGMTVVDAIAGFPRVNAGAPFEELPVRNYTGGSITENNIVIVSGISVLPTYPTGAESALMNFTVENSAPNAVNATLTGTTLTLTPVSGGSANITVRAADVNGNAAEITFVATATQVPPVFTFQPQSQTVATGSTVVLNAGASGASSYQWERDGVPIAGATGPILVISNAGSGNTGTYTSVATNAIGSTESSNATISVTSAAPADTGRLVNLAIRSNAGNGDDTLIVGFSIGGSGSSEAKPLLLRGMGPSLVRFGVGGALADPAATVFQGETAIMTNDNWGGDPAIAARAAAVQAFEFSANDSADAALATSLTPAAYTMRVVGNNDSTGIALAEIYDATAAATITGGTPRLLNVSARTRVGTGDDILIAGFVVAGSTAKTVLIRGVGPALADFGVTTPLADPKLQLLSGQTIINENNDWGGDAQLVAAASSVSAFPLTNPGSKDAVLLVTLAPGNYTVQVSGVSGTTGVALVELYEVQ